MSDKPRARVAVIVPLNRTWFWHHKTISILQKHFEVDVYTDTKGRRYPLILRFWLWLERLIFGAFDLAKCLTISAPLWAQPKEGQYALVSDFSEASLISSDIQIIEPRFEGHADTYNLIAILFAGKNPYISIHVAGQEVVPLPKTAR